MEFPTQIWCSLSFYKGIVAVLHIAFYTYAVIIPLQYNSVVLAQAVLLLWWNICW